MSEEIKYINLIKQDIYTAKINSVNHKQVAFDIENYGKNIKKETPGYGHISRGFVQYEDIVMPVTPEILKLEKEIINILNKLNKKEYYIKDTWAVKLTKDQSVIAHSHHSNSHIHPEEYFSVAYYPSAPEGSAELIFSVEWCNIMKNTVAVKPENGLLVIFNSYITHMTARHSINDPRFVVSMNLSPKIPNCTPNADWSVYWDRPNIENPKTAI